MVEESDTTKGDPVGHVVDLSGDGGVDRSNWWVFPDRQEERQNIYCVLASCRSWDAIKDILEELQLFLGDVDLVSGSQLW